MKFMFDGYIRALKNEFWTKFWIEKPLFVIL